MNWRRTYAFVVFTYITSGALRSIFNVSLVTVAVDRVARDCPTVLPKGGVQATRICHLGSRGTAICGSVVGRGGTY